MKIAISGKGGVGKTLLAALLSRTFAESGYSVLAIDADPCPSLAATLGFPHAEEIIPISEMKDLVEERTGAKPTASFVSSSLEITLRITGTESRENVSGYFE